MRAGWLAPFFRDTQLDHHHAGSPVDIRPLVSGSCKGLRPITRREDFRQIDAFVALAARRAARCRVVPGGNTSARIIKQTLWTVQAGSGAR
jgi:hypothetical protein